MSLQQAHAFYEILINDETIYKDYVHKCCHKGLLGSYHWDKDKIINFASKLGYSFTENELDQVWFETEIISVA